MNILYFDESMKDKRVKFKDTSKFTKLEEYEDYWHSRLGLPSDVLKELGEFNYDVVSDDYDDCGSDTNHVHVILYKDKVSYDKRRGSTIKLLLVESRFNRKIHIRFARDIDTPVYDEWFSNEFKKGFIPIIER